jgi:hypothetical protein
VSFLQIPPETARALQKESPFPEVLALNAAARRARGSDATFYKWRSRYGVRAACA